MCAALRVPRHASESAAEGQRVTRNEQNPRKCTWWQWRNTSKRGEMLFAIDPMSNLREHLWANERVLFGLACASVKFLEKLHVNLSSRVLPRKGKLRLESSFSWSICFWNYLCMSFRRLCRYPYTGIDMIHYYCDRMRMDYIDDCQKCIHSHLCGHRSFCNRRLNLKFNTATKAIHVTGLRLRF